MRFRLPYRLEKFMLDKLGAIHTVVELTSIDKNNEIYDHKKFIGKSLTANFLQSLYAGFANFTPGDINFVSSQSPFTTNSSMIQTGGTVANVTVPLMLSRTSAGNINCGILFGKGTQTVTPVVQAINDKILNGTSANQLQYGNTYSPGGVSISGNVTSLYIQRSAANNSGGNVDISEFAVYSQPNVGSPYHMFYYDLVSPAVRVPNGGGVLGSLLFQITT